MDAKQEDEVRWVERLKELLPDFPVGLIAPWKPDPPDVVVKSPNKIIGIEVSRLVRRTPPGEPQDFAAREGNCNRITETAKRLYEAARLPPVRVAVFFRRRAIRRNDVDPLAKAVFEIVRRNIPAEEGGERVEEYEYTNRDYFPEKIDMVRVNRFKGDDRWWMAEAAWNVQHRSDYLKTAIDSKSGKYAPARQHCDEAWLLLVTDALGFIGSYVEFADEALTAAYATPFDRLLLIHQFARRLSELHRHEGGSPFIASHPQSA